MYLYDTRKYVTVFLLHACMSECAHFKVYGYISIFSAMYLKKENVRDFLFAFLEDEVFPK